MNQIVIYGAQWCNPCKKVKAHLDKSGKEYTFKDIDVEENANELRGLGFSSVPVIVCGDTIIQGFNPEALDKLE